MRISDWSSDVCSSDLLGGRRQFRRWRGRRHDLLLGERGRDRRHLFLAGGESGEGGGDAAQLVEQSAVGLGRAAQQSEILVAADGGCGGVVQLGRGSCRVRVCQYV